MCAGDGSGGGRRGGGAGLRLSRRRHQCARPDEGRRRCGRTVSSTSRACQPRPRRAPPTAACASARWCATPSSHTTQISRAPIRRSPRRSSPARRRSCATRRPSAATCCSGRAAGTSVTWRAPATSASRARLRRAARRQAPARGARLERALHRDAPVGHLRAARRARRRRGDRGRGGRREIALEDLHRLPGDTPERENVLEPGELIVALRLPGEAARFAAHARYLKVRERTSFAFALVSAAAALDLDGGTIRSARLALGGVATKPWRAREAEAALAGATRTRRRFAARPKPRSRARPSGDNAFKIELAQRIVVRALALATAGTPARLPALPASPFSSVPSPCTMPETHRSQSSPRLATAPTSGQPLTRRDGILKVTGRARYAADNHPAGHAVCGVRSEHDRARPCRRISTSKPPRRIPCRRRDDARQPAAARRRPRRQARPFTFRLEALQNDRVRYANQPIAVVIAETLEAATEGAALLARVTRPSRRASDSMRREFPPRCRGGRHARRASPMATSRRDWRRPLRIDATYETPSQYHNAMEPHAIVAAWDGDRLTLDTPNQAPSSPVQPTPAFLACRPRTC